MAIFFIKGMEIARRSMPQKEDLYLTADHFKGRNKCAKKDKRSLVLKLAKKIKRAK